MNYILYSGDYEVFMGGNYFPEAEIVIESASRALEAFESIDIPVTYFADMLCFWRYRELGMDDFPDQVDRQLKDVIKRGHDVQMHIHPHWPQTEIDRRDDGSSHYTFDHKWLYPGAHMGSIYDYMIRYLREGKEYLESLLQEVDPMYKCVAYRAGAYGIMPGDKEIIAALEDSNYVIDSSVVPGYPGKAPENPIVNFRDAPQLGNYRLSREGGVNKAVDKGIFEIPVGASELRLMLPLLRRKCNAIRRRILREAKPHEALGYTANEGYRRKQLQTKAPLIRRAVDACTRATSLSFWGMLDIVEDVPEMLTLTHEYIRKHTREGEDLFFSVSFHPKDFVSKRRSSLKNYHQQLEGHYGAEVKAITFQDAARLIVEKSLKD